MAGKGRLERPEGAFRRCLRELEKPWLMARSTDDPCISALDRHNTRLLFLSPSVFFMQKEPRKVREFRRREQEILDTALKLFLDLGEDSVTVEMIADAVGIGKGTIYKHFKSKAEIYLRLMLDYERDLNELLHSADVDKDKEALSRA